MVISRLCCGSDSLWALPLDEHRPIVYDHGIDASRVGEKSFPMEGPSYAIPRIINESTADSTTGLHPHSPI